jgi:hypothetical protein
MTFCGNPLLRSLFGVKRTSLIALHMSAYDPKRTSLIALHMSAYDPKRTNPLAGGFAIKNEPRPRLKIMP